MLDGMGVATRVQSCWPKVQTNIFVITN